MINALYNYNTVARNNRVYLRILKKKMVVGKFPFIKKLKININLREQIYLHNAKQRIGKRVKFIISPDTSMSEEEEVECQMTDQCTAMGLNKMQMKKSMGVI